EELQEQNLELGAQRVQVEEANRLKSEFLSNMSHELRTPLNSVMALSRVLVMQAREKLSDEEINYLEIIERNGKNLLALINDILDLSKIEAGRMEVSPKPFQISSTIDTIMERLTPLAREKGIELHMTLPDALPQVNSDENRVHQILQNLISNAVKFTQQGKVSISMEQAGQTIHLMVSDTGIGISKNHLPHIFEEFRQVDGTSSRSYEGTGLGLAIASKAAEMLGGNIDVRSTLGQGSTFTLTLPLVYRESTPAPLPEPLAIQPLAETQPTRKTILVVDDEPKSLTMISNYLSREGYNIITATSGQEALQLAQSHRPFAITLDVIMPEMDGFEVLQHLKQTTETKDIPVIMVSMSNDRATGMALGAVGYISKPVNRDLLIAEINSLCGPWAHSILIVEDNEIELKEMARKIEQEGMQAIQAQNGKICMEILQRHKPDALVLDLIMPEMNGFEVLEKIRSNPDTRNLPVIVVTAKSLSMEEKQILSGKASLILEKSEMTSTALLNLIKKILTTIESPGNTLKTVENRNRLLLVEDNDAAIIQVEMFLKGQGYIVDVARGGQEALDYMLKTIPDGIIMDLMMPEIDGFQVLEKMRGTQATANTPVLILTARDLTPEDLSNLSANNVQQLVQKGDIDPQGLLSKIQTMLGKSPVMDNQSSKAHTQPSPPKSAPRDLESTPHEDEPQHNGADPAPGKENTIQRSSVLIVEDNPDNMITLKAILQNQYTLLQAIDGKKGLQMALTTQPDLILLDMSLPEMDGFSVVKRIKEDPEAAHIPVIALTAHAMKGDREKTILAGCDDYLSKPIDPEKIMILINKWLEK
ncbi:MAG: response regulator, partial [Desulfobacterium sp.]